MDGYQGYVAPPPPMYGGINPPAYPSPFANIPGMNSGFGQMAGMILQPFMQSMLGPNYTPMQFAPIQNYYDHLRTLTFYQQRNAAMQAAMAADKKTLIDYQRGLMGNRWNPQYAAAANTLAGDWSGIGSIAAIAFPEGYDASLGSVGSAQVFASELFNAGRFLVDPSTGQLGLTSTEAGLMTTGLKESMYGTPEKVKSMRGVRMGQAGILVREMIARGLFNQGMTNKEAAAAMAKAQGFASPEEFLGSPSGGNVPKVIASDQLANYGPFADKVRTSNIEHVDKQIRGFSQIFTAMKDLFGTFGKKGSVEELFDNIQSLFGPGGMGTFNKDKMEAIVRQFGQTAYLTGFGYDKSMMFNSAISQLLTSQGMTTSASPVLTANAMAFTRAFNNTYGGRSIHGLPDQGELATTDAMLQVSGAKSAVGIALGTILQLGNEVGLSKDSELSAVFDAVRSGKTEYEYKGKRKRISDAVVRENLVRMAKDAGIDERTVNTLLFNPLSGERYTSQTGPLARQLQGEIDAPRMFTAPIMAGLSHLGGTPEQNTERAGTLLNFLLNEAAPQDFEDPKKLNEQMARSIFGENFDTFSESRKSRILQAMSAVRADMDTSARRFNWRDSTQFFTMNNRQVRERAQRIQQQSITSAGLQTLFAGVNRQGFVGRVIDALTKDRGGQNTTFGDVVSEVLGAQSTDELRAELTTQLDKLDAINREMMDPRTADARKKELKAQLDKVLENIEGFGRRLPAGTSRTPPTSAPSMPSRTPVTPPVDASRTTPADAGQAGQQTARQASTHVTGTLRLIGLDRVLADMYGSGSVPTPANPGVNV